jgi:hypothetical protein
MNLCDTHSMPCCRLCKEPDDRVSIPGSSLKARPPKQKPRKEMKRGQLKKTASKKVVWQSSEGATDPEFGLIQQLMLRDGRCFYADFPVSIGGELVYVSCDGPTDPDHIIEQQWIRTHFENGSELGSLADLLALPASSVAACREHHRHKTAGNLIVPRTSLPDEVQHAIKALGYEATLDELDKRREARLAA